MLTIYRRHQRDCKHSPKGRKYRDCSCPIWVQGTLAGESIRESLDLRGWQKAQDKIREWEADGRRNLEERPDQITIEAARIKFIADIEARKLNEATVYKYKLLFRQLEAFALKRGIRFLSELDVRHPW